jgi:hypothetical protein
MSPSRSQRKSVAREMSNSRHISRVVNPASLKEDIRCYTSIR